MGHIAIWATGRERHIADGAVAHPARATAVLVLSLAAMLLPPAVGVLALAGLLR